MDIPTKGATYRGVWLFVGIFFCSSYWLLYTTASWQATERRPWLVARAAGSQQVLGAATTHPPVGWEKITPETYPALITETTAEQVLRRRGVVTDPVDYIRSYPDLTLGVGGTVYLYRAPLVTVVDWGKSQVVHTWQTTVAAVLAEAKIDIGDQDVVSGELPTITIIRVQEADVHVTEPVAFSTQTVADPTREKGQRATVQTGKNGVRTKTFHVRRENGAEVSRVLTKNEITTPSTPEIIKEGTKVVVYGTGTATWYTKSLNHAAAHNTLPKGTKVRVVNTSNGKSTVVTVVGGGLDGALIDLSYDAFTEIGDPGAGRLAVRVEKYYDPL